MSEITGTYRDGHVELDAAVDWPEGSRVRVSAEPTAANLQMTEAEAWGMAPTDYQDTPQFRAKLIAQMDAFEPLALTPTEESEWQAARSWIKDYTIAAVRQQMGLEHANTPSCLPPCDGSVGRCSKWIFKLPQLP